MDERVTSYSEQCQIRDLQRRRFSFRTMETHSDRASDLITDVESHHVVARN